MGKRGPTPKPTQLKILEGNPGKRRLNTKEPKFTKLEKMPSPPRHLFKDARKEWRTLGTALINAGILTEIDLPAFAEVCQNYAFVVIISRRIAEKGEEAIYDFVVTDSGYTSAPPLPTQRNKYYEIWRRSLADFGLTPSSRTRLITNFESENEASQQDEKLKSVEALLS